MLAGPCTLSSRGAPPSSRLKIGGSLPQWDFIGQAPMPEIRRSSGGQANRIGGLWPQKASATTCSRQAQVHRPTRREFEAGSLPDGPVMAVPSQVCRCCPSAVECVSFHSRSWLLPVVRVKCHAQNSRACRARIDRIQPFLPTNRRWHDPGTTFQTVETSANCLLSHDSTLVHL